MAIHLGLVPREKAKMPISQLLPGRPLTALFPSCCTRVWLLISLPLGADHNPLLRDADESWHTFNYCKPLGRSQRFERQSKALVMMIDEFYLLYKTTLSSIGEEAVLSNV